MGNIRATMYAAVPSHTTNLQCAVDPKSGDRRRRQCTFPGFSEARTSARQSRTRRPAVAAAGLGEPEPKRARTNPAVGPQRGLPQKRPAGAASAAAVTAAVPTRVVVAVADESCEAPVSVPGYDGNVLHAIQLAAGRGPTPLFWARRLRHQFGPGVFYCFGVFLGVRLALVSAPLRHARVHPCPALPHCGCPAMPCHAL